MLSIGPFSIRVVAVAVAALLAWLVARVIQRRPPDGHHKSASSLILDVLLLGLIAARVGYVAQWWPDYAASPRAIVALGDGGFDARIGIAAALVFVGWRLRRLPALRQPVLAGIVAGLGAWGIAQGTLATLQRGAPPLAAMPLQALDSTPVLPAGFVGKPVVVNLWATWCAPCRREMPILEQAQRDHPGITVLMLNQGETRKPCAHSSNSRACASITCCSILRCTRCTRMARAGCRPRCSSTRKANSSNRTWAS